MHMYNINVRGFRVQNSCVYVLLHIFLGVFSGSKCKTRCHQTHVESKMAYGVRFHSRKYQPFKVKQDSPDLYHFDISLQASSNCTCMQWFWVGTVQCIQECAFSVFLECASHAGCERSINPKKIAESFVDVSLTHSVDNCTSSVSVPCDNPCFLHKKLRSRPQVNFHFFHLLVYFKE